MTHARTTTWLGAGLVIAATVIAALLVLRPGEPPSLADQARAIAAGLRCPDCAGLSAADSPTQAAAEIRREVEAQLVAGRTADEIRQSFVDRYGPWILLDPPGVAPWLIPVLVTALGTLLLAAWLLRPAERSTGSEATDTGVAAGDPGGASGPPAPTIPAPRARRAALGVAVVLIIALAVGFALPEPYSLAAETVVNQPLAEAQMAEAQRQAEIERLLTVVAADPEDAAALSDLADAYLAGSSALDLQRAAFVLIALIGLDPGDPAPYGRLITAYIRAEDWENAAAANDAYAELTPDAPDISFFRGLIAWQGFGDAAEAIAAFDEFLAAAPDDPRVPMIRALRAEAASDGE